MLKRCSTFVNLLAIILVKELCFGTIAIAEDLVAQAGIYDLNGLKRSDSSGSAVDKVQWKESYTLYTNDTGDSDTPEATATKTKKPYEGSTDPYGTQEKRGTGGSDAVPAKKNGGGDLFGASQIKRPGEITATNRPANIQGLTGLLITNSAFSRPADTGSMGVSVIIEGSDRPKFDTIQFPVTVTYGVTNEVELGIKAKIVSIDDKSGNVAKKNSGIGDAEFLLKGRIIEQQENFPAVAVAMGGILPTGKESEGINEVTHWGAKIIVLASSEAPILEDQFLGLYLEAQLVFIDTFTKGSNKTATAEQYGMINGGVLMPFSFDNRFQAIIEYNRLFDKNKNTLMERDFNAITPALRFATANLNVTIGAQVMKKRIDTYENTTRFIGTVNYSF